MKEPTIVNGTQTEMEQVQDQDTQTNEEQEQKTTPTLINMEISAMGHQK